MSAASVLNSTPDILIRATCGDVRCSKGFIVQHLRVRPELELSGSVADAGLISGHARLIGGLLLGGDESLASAAGEAVQRHGEHQVSAVLTTEERLAVARLYFAEALLAGTTTLLVCGDAMGNGILDEPELRRISALLGIRIGVITPAGEQLDVESQSSAGRTASSTATNLLHLGAVSLLSDDAIRELGVRARETARPVFIRHNRFSEEDAWKRGFGGVLERLAALRALPPGSVLAFEGGLDEQTVRLADAHGVWLVDDHGVPTESRSSMSSVHQHSERLVLGTGLDPRRIDKAMKSPGSDRAASRAAISRGAQLAEEVFGMGLTGQPGDAADLRVLDDAGHVKHVLVAGQPVVRDGQLVSGDLYSMKHAVDRVVRSVLRGLAG